MINTAKKEGLTDFMQKNNQHPVLTNRVALQHGLDGDLQWYIAYSVKDELNDKSHSFTLSANSQTGEIIRKRIR